MANKKISEFPSVATLSDNDIFLINSLGTTSSVTYNTITTNVSAIVRTVSGEITNNINTIVDTLTTVNVNEDNSKPTNEVGFIKQLAKHCPSSYGVAAITTTNRVIVWGLANGGENATGGKLAKTFATGGNTAPSQYVRVPFNKDWQVNAGPTGIDYLDEHPTISIEDLYWNNFGAMALLSDGTCWVAGYNDGTLGVGPAAINVNFRPTCGFVKVTFPTGGIVIKKIKCASDNNTSNMVFTALDTTDTLWVWGGASKCGVFGKIDVVSTAISYATPESLTTIGLADWSAKKTKSTSSSVDITGEILDWGILNSSDVPNGENIAIITKNNNLYISGDNTNGQRGTGFDFAAGDDKTTTKSGFFNHAKKGSGTSNYVNDAASIMETQFAGSKAIAYVSTNGKIFTCGLNDKGYLGNGTVVDSKYFAETSNLGANIVAEKVYAHGYATPTYFAICRNTITNVKTVYSWGYNNATYGYCGVDSVLDFVNAPVQCVYLTTGGVNVPITNVYTITLSDQANKGCASIIDNDGYSYLCGYKNYNDPPLYQNIGKEFRRASLKNIKSVVLGSGASGNEHEWNVFLLKNGSVWGNGDAKYLIFGSADLIKHPCRLL